MVEAAALQCPWTKAARHHPAGHNSALQSTTNVMVNGTNHAHTASLANTGQNTAHNNMQPTIILNYVIKT